jgi:hypothetical protein
LKSSQPAIYSDSVMTQNTLVPISILAAMSAIIFWIATMYVQGANNEKAISELRSSQSLMSDVISKIEQKMSRLEVIMERNCGR